MKLLKTFLIVLLLNSSLTLNAGTFEQQEQKVQKALKAMYNMEYEQARNLFNSVMMTPLFTRWVRLAFWQSITMKSEEYIGYHKTQPAISHQY